MAKTSSVEKNNRRRKLADRYAAKRKALKAIVMDQKKPIEERFRAQLKLAALPRNSAKTRIRNRCEITGRPRAYYRKLKMSRIALRDLGSLGRRARPGQVELVRRTRYVIERSSRRYADPHPQRLRPQEVARSRRRPRGCAPAFSTC